jgi:hypothetical protein
VQQDEIILSLPVIMGGDKIHLLHRKQKCIDKTDVKK